MRSVTSLEPDTRKWRPVMSGPLRVCSSSGGAVGVKTRPFRQPGVSISTESLGTGFDSCCGGGNTARRSDRSKLVIGVSGSGADHFYHTRPLRRQPDCSYRRTSIESCVVVVAGVDWLSRTCTVKVELPSVVARPLMTPVDVLSVIPAGSAPATTLQA